MFDEAINRKHIVMGGVTICASLFFAHVHRQMDLATGTGSFEKAPWSEGGRPFLKGEEKTIDGQQIHDICFLEAWPKGGRYSSLNQGDTLTAADYVSCQGRMIEERPQRLCQSGAKARYLRYLSGYFTWFKEDLARAKGEKVNRYSYRLESDMEITQGTADAEPDSRIVDQLKTFVRLGLLSAKTDLAQVIDVSLIAERSQRKSPAPEYQKICK